MKLAPSSGYGILGNKALQRQGILAGVQGNRQLLGKSIGLPRIEHSSVGSKTGSTMARLIRHGVGFARALIAIRNVGTLAVLHELPQSSRSRLSSIRVLWMLLGMLAMHGPKVWVVVG